MSFDFTKYYDEHGIVKLAYNTHENNVKNVKLSIDNNTDIYALDFNNNYATFCNKDWSKDKNCNCTVKIAYGDQTIKFGDIEIDENITYEKNKAIYQLGNIFVKAGDAFTVGVRLKSPPTYNQAVYIYERYDTHYLSFNNRYVVFNKDNYNTYQFFNITTKAGIKSSIEKELIIEGRHSNGRLSIPVILCGETPEGVTFKDYKAVVDGKEFNIASAYNRHYQNYKSHCIVYDNYHVPYFLTLQHENTESPHLINGLYPCNGGWCTETTTDGNQNILGSTTALPPYHNWSFSEGFKLIGNNIDRSVIEKGLYKFNCALKALNYTINDTASSTITKDNFDEPFWGATLINSLDSSNVKAQVQLNNRTLGDNKSLETNVLVHELGHTLGFNDKAAHPPTIYPTNYDIIQPNDLYWLKSQYLWRYHIDITKSQEEIYQQRDNLANSDTQSLDSENNETNIHFLFPTYSNELECFNVSDIVLNGTLTYIEDRKINIGHEMELDYKVYKIEPTKIFKGNLMNTELKIHSSISINIQNNENYRLYLKQYDNVPCSLINPNQGIEKI